MTIVTPFIKKLLSEKFKCAIFKEIKKKISKRKKCNGHNQGWEKIKDYVDMKRTTLKY